MDFLNQIRSFFQKKTDVSLEYVSFEGQEVFHLTKVAINSGEITIKNQFSTRNIDDLCHHIGDEESIKLIINTDQILSRNIPKKQNKNQLLSTAFPNLDIDDFYYEISDTATINTFVSVSRKKYINDLLDTFLSKNIKVTQFKIGIIEIQHIIPFLKKSPFFTSTHKITSNEDGLEKLEIDLHGHISSYIIENQKIQNTHLVGVSAVIAKMSSTENEHSNTADKNARILKEFSEKLLFKKVLLYGIGSLLVLLLINAFIFNRKFSALHELQDEEQVFSSQKQLLETKLKQIQSKENIVNSILNTGFSKSSFFIDRISQTLPNSLILKELSYQPIEKSIKKSKKVIVTKNKVIVKGKSSSKIKFNDWLKKIEDLDFISQIIISNYGVTKGKFDDFEIILKLN